MSTNNFVASITLNSDAHLRFMERSSKNVKGGQRQKDYAQPKLGDHCVVDLYSCYFGFILPEGPFYRKSIGSNPPKFSSQCIGRNKLAGFVYQSRPKGQLYQPFLKGHLCFQVV